MAVRTLRGPSVGGATIHFSVADPDRELARVRLLHELHRPRAVDFERRPRGRIWTLDFPRPDADRLEYLLELTAADGGTELVCDPANPLTAPGPFGDNYFYPHLQFDAQGSLRLARGLSFVMYGLNINNEVFGFYNGSPQYMVQREYYRPTIAAGFRWSPTHER